MTIKVRINKLYTIRKEILRAIRLRWAFWKFFKILRAGGDFRKFQKSVQFLNFQPFGTNKYIIQKVLKRGTRFRAHFLVFVKNVIFLKSTKIYNYRLKRKNDPRILFLSSRPFEWCICLFKKKLKIEELDEFSKFSKIPSNPQSFEDFRKNLV